MKISCIVAVGENNVIGANNDIPWYLPADLKYFKARTTGHHIIMGRNCYASIGKPLPNRTNIIISRDPFFISSNCLVARSVKEALEMAYLNDEQEVFIIGGGQIYEQTKEIWDTLYLTQVDVNVKGDVFFPELDLTQWNLREETKHTKDEKNEFDYIFKVYDRIANE